MKTVRIVGLLLLALVLVGHRPVLAGAPAAMVTDVKGNVKVKGADGKWTAARLLQQLPPGAQIQVDKGGSASLSFFADGKRSSVSGASLVQVEQAGLKVLKGEAGSVKVVAARKTASGKTMKPVGVTMGGEFHRAVEDFILLTQGAFLKVPALAWMPHSEASGYRIEVEDANGKPIWEGETAETQIALPSDCQLTPSTQYQAIIIPIDRELGTEIDEEALGFFWVVPGDTREAMVALRQAAEEDFNQNPEDPTPLLIIASQFYGQQLYTEALQIAQKVREQRPDDPGIHEFLSAIYLRLGRQDLAQEARRKQTQLEAE